MHFSNHLSFRSALLCAIFALVASPAHALVTACVYGPGVEGLCSTSSGLCTVNSAKNVAPGAVIDCSGRDIFLTGVGTKIIVTGGSFTLKARDLTLDTARSILANTHATIRTGIRIQLSRNLLVAGDILARNGGGGSFVQIVAGGSVTLNGSSPGIALDGTVQSANGGDLRIDAVGFIRVSKLIDVSGKPAGTSDNQNGGGDLVLKSGSDIFIDAELRSFGRWYSGGKVTLDAADDVEISYLPGTGTPKGQIVADGRALDGDGGNVTIIAGDQVKVDGPINVAGGTISNGGEADGGAVDISAGCGGILISDTIDATGGWSGGEVDLSSKGPVTISDLIKLEARQDDGNGGELAVASQNSVTVTNGGSVRAVGHATSTNQGDGGHIVMSGCTVEVGDGAVLEAIGHRGGLIELQGRKSPVGATQFSVKVADGSSINAGQTGIGPCQVSGRIYLDVRSPGPGVCANQPALSCTSRASCSSNSDCINPIGNPDTQGASSQFKPAPRKRLRPEMLACTSVCN